MKWAAHMLAVFTFWFGLLAFLICWAFALIYPALVAAIVASLGCIVAGYFRYADRPEYMRDAPHLGEIRGVIKAGEYRAGQ